MLGGILLLCIFVAVERMPLGVCTAIFFSSPAFTRVLSCIILKDHYGVWRYLVATTLLAGVMVLSRPLSLFPVVLNTANIGLHTNHHILHNHGEANDGGYDLVTVLAALPVPTPSAWIVIITRQAKHVHYSVLAFCFGVAGLVVSIIGVCAIDNDPMFHN